MCVHEIQLFFYKCNDEKGEGDKGVCEYIDMI